MITTDQFMNIFLSFNYCLADIFFYNLGSLAFFGQWFKGAADAAELARIGKYYAVEDMLTEQPEQKYGKVTLRQHYERIAVEGQEYDPYTTMLAPKKK